MRFRRKRNRGTWLPIDPTFFAGSGAIGLTYFDTQETITAAGEEPRDGVREFITAVPVAHDRTAQSDAETGTEQLTMRDLTEGQDYFLDRMVGKVWGSVSQQADIESPWTGIFGIAFAILPVDDENQDQPALDVDDYDPFRADNVMAPWIWRRTWILQDQLSTQQAGLPLFPNTTTGYGSVMDGGHVDAKTKRRIRKDQRLFCVASCRRLTPNSISTALSLDWGFDLRIHGALRRASNKSTFK